jgi:hypothetical protein
MQKLISLQTEYICTIFTKTKLSHKHMQRVNCNSNAFVKSESTYLKQDALFMVTTPKF